MATNTTIEWTDASWNPVTGCSKVSPGCAHCYAQRVFPRAYSRETVDDVTLTGTITRPRKFEDVRCHDDRLEQPLGWKRPRRVFVNSMSDLFHEDVPDEFIDRVFAVMALAPRHTFQILTKRSGRMRKYFAHQRKRKVAVAAEAFNLGKTGPAVASKLVEYQNYDAWPLPNVWLGVSVENNRWRTRILDLLDTPAVVRGVSAEPLLEELDLTAFLHGDATAAPGPEGFRPGPRLDWVIAGGESGQGARECQLDWLRSLRDQCRDAGVAFFLKQLGAAPQCGSCLDGSVCWCSDGLARIRDRKGANPNEWPADLQGLRAFPSGGQ